jgi:K319-like protein
MILGRLNNDHISIYILVYSTIISLLLVLPSNDIMKPAYSQDDTVPTADAGQTQTVNGGENVILNGSKSYDPDGDDLNYYWNQIAGQNVTLSAIRVASPSFIAPNVTNATVLKFQLIVDDNRSSSSPSFVDIQVNPQQSPPIGSQSQSAKPQQLTPTELVIGFIILVVVLVIIRRLTHRGRKYRERHDFPDSVKENVLRKQNHRCANCKRLLNVVDWHHRNGDRSNNKESNCQALCPNCHADISRRRNRR